MQLYRTLPRVVSSRDLKTTNDVEFALPVSRNTPGNSLSSMRSPGSGLSVRERILTFPVMSTASTRTPVHVWCHPGIKQTIKRTLPSPCIEQCNQDFYCNLIISKMEKSPNRISSDKPLLYPVVPSRKSLRRLWSRGICLWLYQHLRQAPNFYIRLCLQHQAHCARSTAELNKCWRKDVK